MSTEPTDALRRRSGAGAWLALTLTLLGLMAADRALVPAAQSALGSRHREVIGADVVSRLYELPGAEPRGESLRLRRTDEVLVTSGYVAVVQSTLAWAEASGRLPLSQTTGLYGVGRGDRRNVSGFGDQERDGWFQPPPDPPRDRLVLWDSFHPGPLTFRFDQALRREGVELLRYELLPGADDDVDDSATYDQLPLVPERYRVRSRVTRAWLLVEPRTGRVVDRQQDSVARFVAAGDGTAFGEAHQISWRYSEEDRARILNEVRHDLRLLWLAEDGLQILTGLLAAFAAAMATQRWRQARRPAADTGR